MKKHILSIFLLIAIPTLCNAETRTLTDKEGKQIEAEILAVRGDEVTIGMNGKEFTLPISKFSDDDIAHMKEWAKANPAPAVVIKENDISVSFKKITERIKQEKEDKSAGKGKAKDGGTAKQTQSSESYLIKVSNNVSKDIPKMQVKYTVYKLVREKVSGETRSSSEDLETIEGSTPKSDLAKLATFEFTTDAVTATDFEKTEKKSGGKTSHSEDIWGVITKVYSGATEIRVDCFPDDMIEKVKAYEEKKNAE